jgi:hypothetical protein
MLHMRWAGLGHGNDCLGGIRGQSLPLISIFCSKYVLSQHDETKTINAGAKSYDDQLEDFMLLQVIQANYKLIFTNNGLEGDDVNLELTDMLEVPEEEEEGRSPMIRPVL